MLLVYSILNSCNLSLKTEILCLKIFLLRIQRLKWLNHNKIVVHQSFWTGFVMIAKPDFFVSRTRFPGYWKWINFCPSSLLFVVIGFPFCSSHLAFLHDPLLPAIKQLPKQKEIKRKIYFPPQTIREPVKNYLADFFPLRGGVPPISAKGFWAGWFSDFPKNSN